MSTKECRDCKYFLQHYILGKNGLVRVFYGHCTFSRVKARRPYARCCENYVEGSPATENFASKEYLTKKLLNHLLNMELLPPVQDDETTAV